MPEHVVTIDLKGLGLTEEQFQEMQSSLHQAALIQVAKLPPFNADGIGIRPIFGPRADSGGPIINGIVVDRLRAAGDGL